MSLALGPNHFLSTHNQALGRKVYLTGDSPDPGRRARTSLLYPKFLYALTETNTRG